MTPLVWSMYPEPPRRRRTGLWVGVGVLVVAVLGAGVAGWLLVGQKLLPARSPQAAVDRLIAGVAAKDVLAVYGSLSPAEVSLVRAGFGDLGASAAQPTSEPSGPASADAAQWLDAFDTLTITVDGVALDPVLLDDGLAKVAVTGGTVTIDGDPQALADAWLGALEQATPLFYDLALDGAGDVGALRDEAVAQLDAVLPYTVSPADDWRVGGEAPFVVTVHEGRGWYVSPLMTLGEYLLLDAGVTRGDMPGPAAGADTPEAAAQVTTRALVELASGDPGALADALPEAERRFLAVYVEPLLASSPAEAGGGDALRAEVTDAAFEVVESDADRAVLTVTRLALQFESGGETGTFTFDGSCLSASGPTESDAYDMCLDDVPLYSELGVSEAAYVAVREDGGWRVSILATAAEQVARLVEGLQRLDEQGKLDDLGWWEEQLGGLASSAGQGDLGGPAGGLFETPGAGDGSSVPGLPSVYGDDPYLDSLADACLAGDVAGCDDLYAEAPYQDQPQSSEYQMIAGSCGWGSDVWLGGGCVAASQSAG